MSQLFSKAAVFSDLHLGLKQNSKEHNERCISFLEWFISEAQKENCDTCIFLGDWHHFRSSLNVSTMNYSLKALRMLSESFQKFFFIPGNHDLFYRDKRDLNSVEFGSLFNNIIIIREPVIYDNVLMVPWLVQDEWKQVKSMKAKYIFGHLELPKFMLNAMVEMPDHGALQLEDFQNSEYLFSGHFHKRQRKDNVIYIGNAFPHNFADAWDDDRGMMILEWDKEPLFINWPDQPIYRTLHLSELLQDPTKVISQNTYARVDIDINITYEEMSFIKEIMLGQLKAKEFSLIHSKNDDHQNEIENDSDFETVDQIVISQLKNIESPNYDINTLLDIYNHL